MYRRGAGIELGRLEKLGDFKLSHATIQQKVRERYGDSIPLMETVISLAAIFRAPNLETYTSTADAPKPGS